MIEAERQSLVFATELGLEDFSEPESAVFGARRLRIAKYIAL